MQTIRHIDIQVQIGEGPAHTVAAEVQYELVDGRPLLEHVGDAEGHSLLPFLSHLQITGLTALIALQDDRITPKVGDLKALVNAGFPVYWQNVIYRVIRDTHGQYLIYCRNNGNTIGLTWSDGVTLNGDPNNFFVPLPEEG